MSQLKPAAIEAIRARADTRGEILWVAERVFADCGFHGTRLQDIADGVGIRRASIVYYFRGKQELYDAVLQRLFAQLLDRIRLPLEAPGEWRQRIKAAVNCWVDFLIERPCFARILLREVADASAGRARRLERHIAPFIEFAEKAASQDSSESWRGFDSFHFASTIAGATLFRIAAMPVLLPDQKKQQRMELQTAEHISMQVQQLADWLLEAELFPVGEI